jgi:hypothetical protein
MSKNISLKEADRKVFTTAFDDGLVDIFIASVVMMFAVAAFLSVYLGDFWSSAIFLPVWGLLFLVLYWVRKNVVQPRIGVVKYGPIRKKKLTLFIGIMLVLNIAFMILSLIAFRNPDAPGWTIPLPFSAMVLVSFSIAGYFLDINRFYAYGIMLGTAPMVGEYLYQNFGASHHGFPVTFGISAVIILLTGLIKLITLLRGNPLPTEEPLLQE